MNVFPLEVFVKWAVLWKCFRWNHFMLLVRHLPKQEEGGVELMHLNVEVHHFLLKRGQIQCLWFRFKEPVHAGKKTVHSLMQTRTCVLYLCTVVLTVSKKIYGIVHMRNNRKSWCFWGGSLETELYPELFNFNYEMANDNCILYENK